MSDQNKEQSICFFETARALGCDEDEAAFKAKLAVIGRQAVKDEVPEPRRQRSGKAQKDAS